MNWAKTQSHEKYNLATSGLKHYALANLPVDWARLAISGPSYYGYPDLQAQLARKNSVGPDSVVAATGTSMANHLAMAAVLEPGDEVLIEEPTYGAIVSTAEYLGAKIPRFPRKFESGF